MAGALLVAHQDVPDGVLGHQLVVERDDGAAGQAEDIRHAQQFEGADDRTGTGEEFGFTGCRRGRRCGGRSGGRGRRGRG
ncbi:hypothetical protein [Cryobacterium breve]|uniref:hypothetical protein n=1 Tax=Cryobacterium breve TaxID=1259258 RepID=UPI00248C6087|nr:hypothetical protein [Cryobacterium breve]